MHSCVCACGYRQDGGAGDNQMTTIVVFYVYMCVTRKYTTVTEYWPAGAFWENSAPRMIDRQERCRVFLCIHTREREYECVSLLASPLISFVFPH